jgi:hypothetical protein
MASTIRQLSATPPRSAPNAADRDHHAGKGDQARGQRTPRRGFAEPQPRQRSRNEGLGGDQHRHIHDLGHLKRGNERDHADRGQGRDEQAALPRHDQLPQRSAALHHDKKHADQAAREQAAPEQDGPGIERQEAREERRRAPGNCGSDDEGNAETAIRTRLPHVDASS